MIISPPFLPDRATLTEEAWLDAAMAQPRSRLKSTGAPEGSFPLSLKLAWHNGLHIQAPQPGGSYLPVRAIADGKVVFVHAPTTPDIDVTHPLNYNPFNDGTPSPAWTSDGFVIIRHTTEIGATGTTPTEVTYFSAYMHLSHIANCPKRNARWETGDDIYRKDELGAPGQIYGHSGQIHFEICCDEASLRQFVPRAPAWANPLAPTAPTADGRTDSVFGSMYVYLPAGTPTSATAPSHHLRRGSGERGGASAASDHFVPDTLQQSQWVQITYDMGNATLYSYTTSGEPIGAHCNVPDFEYDLYAKATERHNSLDAATQTLSSPSGWYELLRFGRNLGPDRLPAHAAHWREIPTATGKVWADLNYLGTFKFSDADFPAFKGWNCFGDDGSPSDQRCDSLHMKTLIRDPDPSNDRRMKPEQLARRLGEPLVRAKLRRAICRFPSEWDRNTVIERYGWLRTEEFRPVEGDPKGTQRWERFASHARAISFTNLPADFLKADWRFHPREFVGQFNQSGWLSAKELSRVLSAAPAAGSGRGNALRFPLNLMIRKYGISHRRLRIAHFLAQVGHETGWWQFREELGNQRYFQTMYEVITVAQAAEDYRSGLAQRLNQVQRGETEQAYASRRPGIVAIKAQSMDNGVVSTSAGGLAGDGPRFRGRGFLQITGRRNYSSYGKFRGLDFTVDPNPQLLASNDFNACDASGFYWARERANIEADGGSGATNITRTGGIINRGSARKVPLHDSERHTVFNLIWSYLSDVA